MLKNQFEKILISLILICISCVEQYSPDISINEIEKIVINGGITDIEGIQEVTISKTSDINAPEFIAYSGCDVKIYDNNNNVFQLYETTPGKYNVYIEKEFLSEGTAFKINILTPEGEIISSNFDTLHLCPEIDSVYFQRFSNKISQSTEIMGIQFYIDYNGQQTGSNYIRWDLYETWENHARYPYRWYLDWLGVHEIIPPDYSKNTCWSTEKILNVYSLSTKNLKEPIYKKYPLHSVKNTTQRLAYGYSLLIKQFTMSEEAYIYYNNIQSTINKEGGLYQTQPFSIEGNLYNISSPEQQILGFFYACGLKTKRIFVQPFEDMPLNYIYYCSSKDIGMIGLRAIKHYNYPADLWLEGGLFWIQENCYDCTCAGGTLEKPEFWPN